MKIDSNSEIYLDRKKATARLEGKLEHRTCREGEGSQNELPDRGNGTRTIRGVCCKVGKMLTSTRWQAEVRGGN